MNPLIDWIGIALVIAAMCVWSYRKSDAPFLPWFGGVVLISALWLLVRTLIDYAVLGGTP